jgi:hypothetical protein
LLRKENRVPGKTSQYDRFETWPTLCRRETTFGCALRDGATDTWQPGHEPALNGLFQPEKLPFSAPSVAMPRQSFFTLLYPASPTWCFALVSPPLRPEAPWLAPELPVAGEDEISHPP